MGYDMSFVRTPSGEDEAVAKAIKVFHQAVEERDAIPQEEAGRPTLSGDFEGGTERWNAAQKKVTDTLDARYVAEKSYFRLNIWGMGRYRGAMHALGMIYPSNEEPGWPEVSPRITEVSGYIEDPGFYETQDDFQAPTDDELAAAKKYIADVKAKLSAHPSGGDTIPAHKFGSNDGWIITPDELKAALKAYESNNEKHKAAALAHAGITDTAYWEQWITYLMNGMVYDGIEVR